MEFITTENPISGESDVEFQDEDFDYLQEIARSSFADMLHDTERNQKYEAALKVAIEKVHREGKQAIVLDIGTGSGLLSMMAVRNGADKVTACEAFTPISDCAVELIELNGFEDKIKVIPKRSVDLSVGENCDLDEKCNILVAEVFDTELIGEGALSTFNHAHDFLLTEDCIVIPNSATIYAQVVECSIAKKWNRMSNIYGDEFSLRVPDQIKYCPGCASVHDFQMSQLPMESFRTLMKPTPIFEFNWSSHTPYRRSNVQTARAECDGEAQAVFMWWDLKMDIENEIILSCAPYWAHPLYENGKIPWRDHWMQAIYYFPRERRFKKGEFLSLLAVHDEYSLWFNLSNDSRFEEADYDVPSCGCLFHTFPRSRIGQINDEHRNKVLMEVIKKKVVDKNVLFISNGFYLSFIASKLKAKKIYIYDFGTYTYKVMLDFLAANEITNVVLINRLDHLLRTVPKNSIDLVISEPFFITSILPWDNLRLYFTLKRIKSLLNENVKIYPKAACVKAIAVQFDDLHKIRAPVKECEGFQMRSFDRLIREASKVCDDVVEPQPLWEYPCTALSSVEEIITIDFSKTYDEVITKYGDFKIGKEKTCNGVAIWLDWLYGSKHNRVISSGAIATPEIGKKIKWDKHCRQGVLFFPKNPKNVNYLDYSFELNLDYGSFKFDCD